MTILDFFRKTKPDDSKQRIGIEFWKERLEYWESGCVERIAAFHLGLVPSQIYPLILVDTQRGLENVQFCTNEIKRLEMES
jgi:hypothetical protein